MTNGYAQIRSEGTSRRWQQTKLEAYEGTQNTRTDARRLRYADLSTQSSIRNWIRRPGYARRLKGRAGTDLQTLLASHDGSMISGADHRSSHDRNHLRPDRDHAKEQRDRGQRGGFFNNSTEHDSLLRTDREHRSSYVLLSSSGNGSV